MKTKIIVCASSLSLMATSMVFAASSNVTTTSSYKDTSTNSSRFQQMPPQIKPFAELPALYLWGYGGAHTIGEGQGLVPLMSSNQTKNFYLLAEGKETANTAAHYFGAGVGYRQVVNNNRIFGGYLVVDDNFTDHLADKDFVILNPGIETLGNIWDFRMNGYFPLGSKNWDTGTHLEDITFEGHDEAADVYDDRAFIGNGVDAEIGAKIPKLDSLKIFVGGYYFDQEDTDSITGASGRLEFKVNNYLTLEARDTQDNLNNNKALIGVRISLGGVKNKGENGISDRLLDPVVHNLATAAEGNSVPISTGSGYAAGHVKQNKNPIEFVDNTPSTDDDQLGQVEGDGTFENPYKELNNDVIADIQTQPGTNAVNIYVEGGAGTTPYSLTDSSNNSSLMLPDDYSIYGRTDNFKRAATGANRPELDGGIAIVGDTTLDSIQLMNDGTQDFGILITNPTAPEMIDVNLNNVLVGTIDPNQETKMFGTGIEANNDATLNMSNSNIYGADASGGAAAVGMVLGKDVTVNLKKNNTIEGAEVGPSVQTVQNNAVGIGFSIGNNTVNFVGNNNNVLGFNSSSGPASGILIDGGTNQVINVDSSRNVISGEVTGTTSGTPGIGIGVLIAGTGNALNVTGNSNTISGANYAGGEAFGIFSIGATNAIVNITSNRNTISALTETPAGTDNAINNSVNDGLNDGAAIAMSDGTLVVSGSGNTLTASTDSGVAAGIVFGSGSISVSRATINATSTDPSAASQAFGIALIGPTVPTSVRITNNTFNVNASALGVSDGMFIAYSPAPSNPIDFTITGNRFNVTGGVNAIGIEVKGGTQVDPNALNQWKTRNNFRGNITPNNRVVITP